MTAKLQAQPTAGNRPLGYDADPHLAEIYDATERQLDDLALLRRLIAGRGPWRVLEPFCGTGRLLLPLASDGHTVVGIDGARPMLDRAQAKALELPDRVGARVTLRQADVIASEWPTGFDLVVLGGNCLYELATAEEQALCIARAARALKPGGYLYLDSDHMEGPLDATWQQAEERPAYPSGSCADGTVVRGYLRTLWFDAAQRLVRLERRIVVVASDGQPSEHVFQQQKHPVSREELRGWLSGNGFIVERECGDRAGRPYQETAPKAIFWARRP